MHTMRWIAGSAVLLLTACSQIAPPEADLAGAELALQQGYQHGIVIEVDGTDYYLAGAPDGPEGATDIPGHYWVLAGKDQLVGKHFNTGPFDAPQWWSSDAPDGAFLYTVHAIIDTWTPELAEAYIERGYVHYHELVAVDGGALHASKVVWLKHTARTFFTLDGGPHPELSHDVRPGMDLEFIPNAESPYPSTSSALRGKPNFTAQLWGDGELWGTKAAAIIPAPRPGNEQSFDKLFVVTNSNNPDGQLPVSEAAPGNPAYNGGRWFTHTVVWTQAGFDAHGIVPVLTSYEDVMLHEGLGHLDITAGSPPGGPPDYFECPLLPVKD